MANMITRWITWLQGEFVGEDDFGNRYYQSRQVPTSGRRRRWVVYAAGGDEATRVPPQHHGWLHYTLKDFPKQGERRKYGWVREHQPNPTGSPNLYLPPGHTLAGGKRDHATGDYEAWTPE